MDNRRSNIHASHIIHTKNNGYYEKRKKRKAGRGEIRLSMQQ